MLLRITLLWGILASLHFTCEATLSKSSRESKKKSSKDAKVQHFLSIENTNEIWRNSGAFAKNIAFRKFGGWSTNILQEHCGSNRMSAFQVQVATDNVRKRGLVAEQMKFKDVLKEHKAYCETEREIKHFDGQTLAYVTPASVDAFRLLTVTASFSPKLATGSTFCRSKLFTGVFSISVEQSWLRHCKDIWTQVHVCVASLAPNKTQKLRGISCGRRTWHWQR